MISSTYLTERKAVDHLIDISGDFDITAHINSGRSPLNTEEAYSPHSIRAWIDPPGGILQSEPAELPSFKDKLSKEPIKDNFETKASKVISWSSRLSHEASTLTPKRSLFDRLKISPRKIVSEMKKEERGDSSKDEKKKFLIKKKEKKNDAAKTRRATNIKILTSLEAKIKKHKEELLLNQDSKISLKKLIGDDGKDEKRYETSMEHQRSPFSYKNSLSFVSRTSNSSAYLTRSALINKVDESILLSTRLNQESLAGREAQPLVKSFNKHPLIFADEKVFVDNKLRLTNVPVKGNFVVEGIRRIQPGEKASSNVINLKFPIVRIVKGDIIKEKLEKLNSIKRLSPSTNIFTEKFLRKYLETQEKNNKKSFRVGDSMKMMKL